MPVPNRYPPPYVSPDTLDFDSAALDRAWISLVEGAEAHEYGGAVALVARHGQIALHRATGWAVREPVADRSPMGVDTIFDLASLTKVTATLPSILSLIADGRLGLDAPVVRGAGKTLDGWVGFISPVAEFTPKSVETSELRTDLVYEVRVFVSDPDDANCPACLGKPAALLIDNGITEDGRRVLVHVWPDGTGELAYAPQGTTSWGVPFPLVPAP